MIITIFKEPPALICAKCGEPISRVAATCYYNPDRKLYHADCFLNKIAQEKGAKYYPLAKKNKELYEKYIHLQCSKCGKEVKWDESLIYLPNENKTYHWNCYFYIIEALYFIHAVDALEFLTK